VIVATGLDAPLLFPQVSWRAGASVEFGSEIVTLNIKKGTGYGLNKADTRV